MIVYVVGLYLAIAHPRRSGIAAWITNTFGVAAVALRDIGLRDAEDPEIYEAAKAQEVIIMTAERTLRDLRFAAALRYRADSEWLNSVRAKRNKY